LKVTGLSHSVKLGLLAAVLIDLVFCLPAASDRTLIGTMSSMGNGKVSRTVSATVGH
jgi:hypothetical protein